MTHERRDGIIVIHSNGREACGVAQYSCGMLFGAACTEMRTLLVDICGFSGRMDVYGIAMPFSPA